MTQVRHDRILFVCNVFDEATREARGVTTDSPAASAKVTAVCRAMRRAGGDVWIVSLGRGRQQGTYRWSRGFAKRMSGVSTLYAAFWDAPILTHVVTAVSLCLALKKLRRRRAVAVFYNPQAHYLLGLLLAELIGFSVVLDLEDGCSQDQRDVRSRLVGLLMRVYGKASHGKALLAATALDEQLGPGPRYVCYGVATALAGPEKRWIPPIQVLFGGSHFAGTGTGLFIDALKLLREQRPDLLPRLHLVITGFGATTEYLEKTAKEIEGVSVDFRGRVSREQYEHLLRSSHVGLCLKLPHTTMGSTTFPSKVIEFAANGLAVLSTRVSDVPLLFDEKTAELLPEAAPESLVRALARLAEDLPLAESKARAGQTHISMLLSEQRIGVELLAFLERTG